MIIAHRGATDRCPENSLSAFERAERLGADGFELDVRLAADGHPVVYHYFYLQQATTGQGLVSEAGLADLQKLELLDRDGKASGQRLPTLQQVLEIFAGRLYLEIELKGPEPAAPAALASVLEAYRSAWDRMEVTSYEPALLLAFGRLCPGLEVDLLMPRSEPWMGADVLRYLAVQRGRLAGARAVHLHPEQLDEETTAYVRENGLEVHAWDVNSPQALSIVQSLGIPQFSTDELQQALDFYDRPRPLARLQTQADRGNA